VRRRKDYVLATFFGAVCRRVGGFFVKGTILWHKAMLDTEQSAMLC